RRWERKGPLQLLKRRGEAIYGLDRLRRDPGASIQILFEVWTRPPERYRERHRSLRLCGRRSRHPGQTPAVLPLPPEFVEEERGGLAARSKVVICQQP